MSNNPSYEGPASDLQPATASPTPIATPLTSSRLSAKPSRNFFCPADWRVQVIEAAIKDIERAEFVALDFEFSGLFRAGSRQHHNPESYFKDCLASAKEFMALQLGVCPAWRSEQTNVWQMAPYNFHIFPSDRKVFSSDTSTLAWLLDNGFSFENWIRNGFDVLRLAEVDLIDEAKHRNWRRNWEKAKDEGLQRVFDAIIVNSKPVVMHNALFDMLHVVDKFIGEVPDDLPMFCHEWMRLFNGGTFDTKRVATERLHTLFHLERGTTLSGLYQTLHQKKFLSHMVLAPRYYKDQPPTDPAPMTGIYSLTPSGQSKSHEAGYDALVTAQVFLMELEIYHRGSLKKKSAENVPESETIAIPLDWRTSNCFGAVFTNVIELPKIGPGMIALKLFASRCHPVAISPYKWMRQQPFIKHESRRLVLRASPPPPEEVGRQSPPETPVSKKEPPRKKRRTEEDEGEDKTDAPTTTAEPPQEKQQEKQQEPYDDEVILVGESADDANSPGEWVASENPQFCLTSSSNSFSLQAPVLRHYYENHHTNQQPSSSWAIQHHSNSYTNNSAPTSSYRGFSSHRATANYSSIYDEAIVTACIANNAFCPVATACKDSTVASIR